MVGRNEANLRLLPTKVLVKSSIDRRSEEVTYVWRLRDGMVVSVLMAIYRSLVLV